MALALIAVSVGVLHPGVRAGEPPPLPPCVIDDVVTRYTEPEDWRRTLLDWALMVPREYRPADLIFTDTLGFRERKRVSAVIAADLEALREAAQDRGIELRIDHGFRSWRHQQTTFEKDVAQLGYERAIRYSARPGHSEHHLGTTIDFENGYRWLARHGWEYGFVMSYPSGMRSEVCYRYEPWHWRYLGRDTAATIRSQGITLRRYLWENF